MAMFGKLKNKLKDWTKNLSKKAEEIEEVLLDESEEEKPEEKLEKEIEKTKKKIKQAEKEVEEVKKDSDSSDTKVPSKKSKADKKAEKEEKKRLAKEKKQAKREEKKAKKFEKKELKEKKKGLDLPEREETKTVTEIIQDDEDQKLEELATEKVEKEIQKLEKIEKDFEQEKEKLQKPDLDEPAEIQEEFEREKKEIEKPLDSEVPSKKSFFKKITQKISKVKISEENFNVYAEELEMLLIENNVALEVAEKIVKQLREEIVGKEMLKKEIEGQIQESFKDIIREILIEPFNLVDKVKEFRSDPQNKDKPYVILFCGVNGTGKTTSIAKIAQQMKDNGLKSVLAAADTFRAASIEQIKKHAKKLDLNVIAHDYGSDPAAVGFDAIKYAEKNKIDVVLIDTAGRMHTEKNLMTQIEKVAKVTKPNTKIFVGESITGNDIVEQVKSFDWAVQLDGIILSKADIDEKGGTALSVGYVTKKPILYLGTGQEYDKIEPFDKEKFLDKLGLNDEGD